MHYCSKLIVLHFKVGVYVNYQHTEKWGTKIDQSTHQCMELLTSSEFMISEPRHSPARFFECIIKFMIQG